MFIRKVLIITGRTQYGALTAFAEDIAVTLRQNGISVDFYRPSERAYLRYIYFPQRYDIVFSFNGMGGGSMEKDVNELAGREVPQVQFFVDHPLHHMERLDQVRGDHHILFFIDRSHVDYVHRYYPNLKYAYFMPHGGSIPGGGSGQDKIYDAVLFGSCADPDKYRERTAELGPEYALLYEELTDRLYRNDHTSLEAELRHFLKRHQADFVPDEKFRLIMQQLHGVDFCVRNKKRIRTVEALLDAGIKVDVWGKGWEDISFSHTEHLTVHPPVDYRESLNIMGRCKVVINTMAGYFRGSHERVFDSMLSGAVCVTEGSEYLEENFVEGKEIFYYSVNDLPGMTRKVKDILSGKYDAPGITDRARVKALQGHTWANRADQILRLLENFSLDGNQLIQENLSKSIQESRSKLVQGSTKKKTSYLEEGISLFNEDQFSEAVPRLIRAYNTGADRDQIEAFLYDCFINPNRAEFEKNYAMNRGDLPAPDYGVLTFDFIPVKEDYFYLFDRHRKRFAGNIDLRYVIVGMDEKSPDALLAVNVWDIRDFCRFAAACRWRCIYYVMEEGFDQFASFFKLPGLESFFKSLTIFRSMGDLVNFLRGHPDMPFPESCISADGQDKEWLRRLRQY